MSNDFVFGLHAVQAIVERSPQDVLEVFVSKERDDKRMHPLVQQLRQQGIAVQFCHRKTLDNLVQGQHQGIVAKVRLAQAGSDADLMAIVEQQAAPLLLVLDGVTDPHNLGAILRSADAAGVHAVVVPKDRSVKLTSVVRKVACGAAETVPFIAVTNLARALRQLQEAGVWVIGTAGETEQTLYQTELTGPLAIVLGAEGDGLRRLTRETCDALVKIPMHGSVSSLNVSVAAGICLFEAVRQRLLS
ncbi:23S rRNA (guanosine(2251)-2'-O)-methyltransferase RlmB [Alkalimonas sp. NCh-2]|uniref:23S rRNA (guanosine(2251)-2'-O)-methyltransferase RlmB n=1 Tax=Alkalimonas sp. NCh-2 TaxID=3144846 RepID=UPI0031F621A2